MKEVTVAVEKIVAGGAGFGRLDGEAVFIPYACPGDIVQAEITKKKKDYAFAHISEIKHSSKHRVEPSCTYYFNPQKARIYGEKYRYCGGCDFQHIDYPKQLEIKENILKEALFKIGGLKDIPVLPIIPMENPWGYRNKIQLPVGVHKKKLLIGFYKPGSHEIVDILDCLVQDKLATPVIDAVRVLIDKYRFFPYNEETHRGWLRHILIRTARYSENVFVVLITRSENFPKVSQFCAELKRKAPRVSGIFQNINPGKTNVILGRKTKKIWGEDFITEKIGQITYLIKSTAFFQINPVQTEKLYKLVKDMAGCTGNETVFDLYCGSGGIGIFLAEKAKKIIGIDESFESIESARMNARYNKLPHCMFIQGRVEHVLLKYRRKDVKKPIIILDPPRSGCSEKVLQMVAQMNGKIMYVSCNPATLARDIKILVSGGYHLDCIAPVDMFPHTSHIEAVAVLI